MKFIWIQTDSYKQRITTDVANQYKYFIKLQNDFPDFGTKKNPYLLDISKDSLEHLINLARYNDKYTYPEIELPIYKKFQSNKIDKPVDFIKINVNDHIFYSTNKTLLKSHYFNCILNKFNQPIPEYIDRDHKSFSFILNYLRNKKYEIPDKYKHELDFYGINLNYSYTSLSNFINIRQ